MKSRTFVLIFVFGLFLFLLPNVAEALCPICCHDYDIYGIDCAWTRSYEGSFSGVERIGIIGAIEHYAALLPGYGSCTDSFGKCKMSAFPTGYNGQNCTARDAKWTITGCQDCFKTGDWDYSDSKCVECNGKIENRILGDTSSVGDVCNNNFIYGDDQCESACGADVECDEKYNGLVSGGTCEDCEFIPTPSCASACENDGYYYGVCIDTGSCPYSIGDNCFYGCYVKTGTTCDNSTGDTCYCIYNDSSKPSCNYYSSGNTCYFDGSAECGISGWDCINYNNCYMDCCDCTSSGCYSNDSECRADFFCDSRCDCQGPDLDIIDIESFTADKKVHYEIENVGDAPADSSYSYLYIDGSYKEDDDVGSISIGVSKDKYFSTWECVPGEKYSIKVCADGRETVNEEEEGNNCRTETLTCPTGCIGDLTVLISGQGSCTITSSLTATDCNGKSWEIRDNGTTKCSGTVPNNEYPYTCPYWTVTEGTYTYKLYIDNTEKDNKTVICQSLGAFDFDITITPGSGSVVQGQSVLPEPTVSTILTSGTTENVAFYVALSSLPSGATAFFNPTQCNPDCSSNMTISTSVDTPIGDYNINVCAVNDGSTVINCVIYTLTVTEIGAAITPPSVETVDYENLTQISVTLKGKLNSCGGADTCLVWFKYGTNASSYNSSTLFQTVDCNSVSFPYEFDSGSEIFGLTSATTYYFEAFAKNGGSW